jgi:hypothetical protein
MDSGPESKATKRLINKGDFGRFPASIFLAAMTIPNSIERALAATHAFIEAESELLRVGANERSLTHKLAEHLQREFADWNVDCEYNRLEYAIKRLPPAENISSDDVEGRTIFPDIIIHRRTKRDNLLVIEVKKSTNTRAGDDEKLIGLTREAGAYGYLNGLHLILDCAACRISGLTAYTDGAIDPPLSQALRDAFL